MVITAPWPCSNLNANLYHTEEFMFCFLTSIWLLLRNVSLEYRTCFNVICMFLNVPLYLFSASSPLKTQQSVCVLNSCINTYYFVIVNYHTMSKPLKLMHAFKTTLEQRTCAGIWLLVNTTNSIPLGNINHLTVILPYPRSKQFSNNETSNALVSCHGVGSV